MNITVQDITDTRKSVIVTVPASDIKQEETKLLGEFSKQAKIPGFRPGKAPANMIKSRFAKEIKGELGQRLTSKAYQKAIEESKYSVYAVIEVDGGDFKADEDHDLTFTLDVRPDFELPKYEGLEIQKQPIEATAEEVQQTKEYLLNQRAEYNVVEKAAEKGDYVKISYEGKIGDEAIADLVPDQPIYGKQATTWEEAGAEGAPGIKSIIDGVIGMKNGDKKDIEHAFADDFEVEALKGKTATYAVEVQEIREKVLPEVNEEFLKSVQAESVEQWEEKIKADVEGHKAQNNDRALREQIINQLDQAVDIPLPESGLEAERENLLRDYMSRAMQQGATEGQLEEQKDELFKGATDAAKQRLKSQIILGEIAKKEEITVENEDMSPRIMQEAMQNRIKPEQLVKELQKDRERLQNMQREVLLHKTLAFLVDKANVTESEEPNHQPA